MFSVSSKAVFGVPEAPLDMVDPGLSALCKAHVLLRFQFNPCNCHVNP